MIDFFKDEPMDFKPGEEYRYNNSAYFILGYIIELVSGKTYAEYIDETFFKPLGMNNSYYGNTSKIIENRAAGYQKNGDNYENADFLSITQPYSAGSLLSTVDDLAKWYQAVVQYKVVKKESLDKALTSYVLKNGQPTNYGFGWSLENIQGSSMFGHGGGINGYLTASNYLKNENIFVAVFSNCTAHPPGDEATKIAALVLGKPFAWERIDIPEKQLKEYEGVYESKYDNERIITTEDGKLFSIRTGSSKYEFIPYEKDKFFVNNGFTTLEFIRNKKKKIIAVISKSTSAPIRWEKTDKEIPVKRIFN
ncbi:MAG: serine hydrolase [Chloroflexia bacterium]|nr:serine hydrolase [Chloroflexia bacterium]